MGEPYAKKMKLSPAGVSSDAGHMLPFQVLHSKSLDKKVFRCGTCNKLFVYNGLPSVVTHLNSHKNSAKSNSQPVGGNKSSDIQVEADKVGAVGTKLIIHVAPEITKLAPEITKLAPEITKGTSEIANVAPEITKAALEITKVAPEITKMAPEITKLAPEITKVVPEITKVTPEITKVASEITKVTPEITKAASEITKVAPEITKATPEINIVAPEITKVAPEIAIVAPEITIVAPEITKVAPEIIKVAPEITIVAPKITKAAPKITKATPEITKSAPGITKVVPEITKVASEIANVAPEITKAAPEITKVAPEITRMAPEITKVAPEKTKAAAEKTKAAPEITKVAPEITKVAPGIVHHKSDIFESTAMKGGHSDVPLRCNSQPVAKKDSGNIPSVVPASNILPVVSTCSIPPTRDIGSVATTTNSNIGSVVTSTNSNIGSVVTTTKSNIGSVMTSKVAGVELISARIRSGTAVSPDLLANILQQLGKTNSGHIKSVVCSNDIPSARNIQLVVANNKGPIESSGIKRGITDLPSSNSKKVKGVSSNIQPDGKISSVCKKALQKNNVVEKEGNFLEVNNLDNKNVNCDTMNSDNTCSLDEGEADLLLNADTGIASNITAEDRTGNAIVKTDTIDRYGVTNGTIGMDISSGVNQRKEGSVLHGDSTSNTTNEAMTVSSDRTVLLPHGPTNQHISSGVNQRKGGSVLHGDSTSNTTKAAMTVSSDSTVLLPHGPTNQHISSGVNQRKGGSVLHGDSTSNTTKAAMTVSSDSTVLLPHGPTNQHISSGVNQRKGGSVLHGDSTSNTTNEAMTVSSDRTVLLPHGPTNQHISSGVNQRKGGSVLHGDSTSNTTKAAMTVSSDSTVLLPQSVRDVQPSLTAGMNVSSVSVVCYQGTQHSQIRDKLSSVNIGINQATDAENVLVDMTSILSQDTRDRISSIGKPGNDKAGSNSKTPSIPSQENTQNFQKNSTGSEDSCFRKFEMVTSYINGKNFGILQETTMNMPNSIKKMQNNTKSLENSVKCMQNSTKNIENNTKNLQNNTAAMQSNTGRSDVESSLLRKYQMVSGGYEQWPQNDGGGGESCTGRVVKEEVVAMETSHTTHHYTGSQVPNQVFKTGSWFSNQIKAEPGDEKKVEDDALKPPLGSNTDKEPWKLPKTFPRNVAQIPYTDCCEKLCCKTLPKPEIYAVRERFESMSREKQNTWLRNYMETHSVKTAYRKFVYKWAIGEREVCSHAWRFCYGLVGSRINKVRRQYENDAPLFKMCVDDRVYYDPVIRAYGCRTAGGADTVETPPTKRITQGSRNKQLSREEAVYRASSEYIERCALCPGVTFRNLRELNRHRNRAHPGENKQKCPVCGIYLPLGDGWKAKHMRQHMRGDRMYAGPLSYPCRFCDQGFKNPETRKTHVDTAHRMKKMCEICGMSVKKLSIHMRRHKRVPDGGYQCHRCGRPLRTYGGLRRHLTLIHGEQLPPGDTNTHWNIHTQIHLNTTDAVKVEEDSSLICHDYAKTNNPAEVLSGDNMSDHGNDSDSDSILPKERSQSKRDTSVNGILSEEPYMDLFDEVLSEYVNNSAHGEILSKEGLSDDEDTCDSKQICSQEEKPNTFDNFQNKLIRSQDRKDSDSKEILSDDQKVTGCSWENCRNKLIPFKHDKTASATDTGTSVNSLILSQDKQVSTSANSVIPKTEPQDSDSMREYMLKVFKLPVTVKKLNKSNCIETNLAGTSANRVVLPQDKQAGTSLNSVILPQDKPPTCADLVVKNEPLHIDIVSLNQKDLPASVNKTLKFLLPTVSHDDREDRHHMTYKDIVDHDYAKTPLEDYSDQQVSKDVAVTGKMHPASALLNSQFRAFMRNELARQEVKSPMTPEQIAEFKHKIQFHSYLGSCAKCPHMEFKDGAALRKHRSVMHPPPKGCWCPLCGQWIKTQRYLKVHVRIHLGKKPFLCEVCGKGFVDASSRRKHYKVRHTQRALAVCDVCGRGVHILSQHMKLHSPQHQCHRCGKRFSHHSGLRYHLHSVHRDSTDTTKQTVDHEETISATHRRTEEAISTADNSQTMEKLREYSENGDFKTNSENSDNNILETETWKKILEEHEILKTVF